VKISPVNTEIALLIVEKKINKKEDIMEGKIYSQVGGFAERAKNLVIFQLFAQMPPYKRISTKFCTDLEVVDVITCDNFLAIA